MSDSANARLQPQVQALGFPEVLRGTRILLATESFGPVNGVSRTTLNLVEYLRENGVKVAVVAPKISTGSSPGVRAAAEDGQIEVRVQGYPLPYNPELSVVYPVRLSQIYARTFKAPPDLIYLASPASLGFQILLQLRQQQKPVPVLLNFQTDLSGYCEILFPAPLDTWAVWVFLSVQGYLFRHSSVRTVFYPSMSVRKYLEKAKVQPRKMMNLRRGVDGAAFNPSKRSHEMRRKLAPNGQTIFVTVARLAPEKGFEFLAEAVKKLDQRGLPFRLLIVGGNPSQHIEDGVKTLFKDLSDQGKVSFAGFLEGEELATAYASGDVFLHCSITETFGLVVLESMASGVPVIARDEGGPSEIVVDGQSGFLVSPSDLNGFVDRAVQLGKEVTLRKRMGFESREMAEEATWDKINNQVAWKLAEALNLEVVDPDTNAFATFTVPVYSWLLLSPQLRSLVTPLIVDARLVAGIWIIIGAWVGLVITWVLVQLSLVVRSRSPWMHDI